MSKPRLLTPADAAAYVALRREMLTESPWAFLSSPGDDMAGEVESVAAKLAEPENEILAVEDDGAPGGFVAAAGVYRQPRPKTRHRAGIWGVYVTPRARGRGLGRAVMLAAIQTARSWEGVEVVSLCVARRESGEGSAAIRLYESLGFERWGEEPDAMRLDGERITDLHMQLRV